MAVVAVWLDVAAPFLFPIVAGLASSVVVPWQHIKVLSPALPLLLLLLLLLPWLRLLHHSPDPHLGLIRLEFRLKGTQLGFPGLRLLLSDHRIVPPSSGIHNLLPGLLLCCSPLLLGSSTKHVIAWIRSLLKNSGWGVCVLIVTRSARGGEGGRLFNGGLTGSHSWLKLKRRRRKGEEGGKRNAKGQTQEKKKNFLEFLLAFGLFFLLLHDYNLLLLLLISFFLSVSPLLLLFSF